MTTNAAPREPANHDQPDSKLWLAVLLGVTVSLALAVWTDLGAILAALEAFPLVLVPIVLGLTVANQALRFVRWERLLDTVDVDLPTGASARVFTSGLAMILTPGKLGEVWKGWLVQETADVPLDKTIPVVGVERFTDVLGVLALSLLGVLAFGGSGWLLAGLLAVLVGLVLVLHREDLVYDVLGLLERVPKLDAITERLDAYYSSSKRLLAPKPLATALVLSVIGWSMECLGTWIVLQGLGADVSLAFAAFAFALASIVGAISMLPGGLGFTEASLVGLLVGYGVPEGTAAAATLVVRAATLWFVAATALFVHFTHRARTLAIDPNPTKGSA